MLADIVHIPLAGVAVADARHCREEMRDREFGVVVPIEGFEESGDSAACWLRVFVGLGRPWR